MGGLLGSIIIGLVVGAIAKLLMPGRQGGGILVTMLLGLAGSLVATFVGRAIGLYGPDSGAGFIASVIGALIVLFIWGRVAGRT